MSLICLDFGDLRLNECVGVHFDLRRRTYNRMYENWKPRSRPAPLGSHSWFRLVMITLHICILYTALAPCLLASSNNGNLVQPTQKRFNSAYLQNKFCICRTIPSHTWGLDHKSPWCSIKKNILKTKKSESDFQLWTPPAKPAKQKNPLDIENSVR